MTALRVPKSWDGLSAEWMTAVLATRFPGAEIGSASLLWVSDGTNWRA
jgi:hypothetical protein